MNMHTPIEPATHAGYDSRDTTVAAPPRRRRLLVIGAVVVILLIAAGAYFAMRGGGAAAGADAKAGANVPNVTVMVPGLISVASDVRVTGSIAARRDMPVGVQGEGGMVNAVLVEAGDMVRAGQVLARIDRSVQTPQVAQLQASVAQARADAALAQADLDRAQKLVSNGFVSRATIDLRTATRDSANARVAVVAAQLRESQARLARLDVRAPDDGLVLDRMVEPGQIVGAGSPALFRVAMDGAMEMRGRVAEQDMVRLAVGQPARVRLVGSPRVFEGEVMLLEPTIDVTTRQGEARIALARDSMLRVGAFANATITAGTAQRPVLPQSAVQVDDKGSFVYIVGAGNKAERRDIDVGSVSNDGIAVASGLTGNERVVLSAGAFLNPGDRITPVLQKTGA